MEEERQKHSEQQQNHEPIPSPEIVDYACPCCYPPFLVPKQMQQRRSFPPPPWQNHHYPAQHHHHHRQSPSNQQHEGGTGWPYTTALTSEKKITPPHHLNLTLPLRSSLKGCCEIPRREGGCYIQHPYHSTFGKFVQLKFIYNQFYEKKFSQEFELVL